MNHRNLKIHLAIGRSQEINGQQCFCCSQNIGLITQKIINSCYKNITFVGSKYSKNIKCDLSSKITVLDTCSGADCLQEFENSFRILIGQSAACVEPQVPLQTLVFWLLRNERSYGALILNSVVCVSNRNNFRVTDSGFVTAEISVRSFRTLLFALSKKLYSGSNNPKRISFNFGNRRTGGRYVQ